MTTNKPFIIVLGDTGEDFKTHLILKIHIKKIIGHQNWILASSDHYCYWLISEVTCDLKKEIIHYKNPIVYLIVNYKSNSYLESLEKYYQIIYKDLILSKKYQPSELTVIGINYNETRHKKMKIKILKWCVDTKLDYLDFNHLHKF